MSCCYPEPTFFFFAYIPSPKLGLTPPGTYNPNARESDAWRGSNSLWTRTLDRYTRAGLPEYVVSTMLGPSPKTTQDTNKGYTPRTEIKIPDPSRNRTRPPGWKAGSSPTTPRRRIQNQSTRFLFFFFFYVAALPAYLSRSP